MKNGQSWRCAIEIAGNRRSRWTIRVWIAKKLYISVYVFFGYHRTQYIGTHVVECWGKMSSVRQSHGYLYYSHEPHSWLRCCFRFTAFALEISIHARIFCRCVWRHHLTLTQCSDGICSSWPKCVLKFRTYLVWFRQYRILFAVASIWTDFVIILIIICLGWLKVNSTKATVNSEHSNEQVIADNSS